ncbi:MAG: hypothetical protein QF662_02180, partial [Phycisphaerae bacterium]|nr:hypothetical protein [Phycisphaerae bacterium]
MMASDLCRSRAVCGSSLLVVVAILSLSCPAAFAREPVIPADRMVDWQPGVEGGIPNVKTQIRLQAEALAKGDAGKLIQEAIERIKPPGAVLLPEGTFNLKSRLLLKS